MNGVLGMIDLILTSDLSEQQRRHAETALRSARGLLDVLNDILDFSKIEAGKLEIEEIDFDLHDLVTNSCQLFAERAHSKGLELEFQIDEVVPAHLMGDPTRLSQILANLIGNAVKFTEEGEIRVEVVTARSEAKQHCVQFSVHDTGVGLTAEACERIFESFHQADGSTTRKFGGTGLGLAISKQLVELMQGRIWVESEPERGSVFRFEVPLKESVISSEEVQVPGVPSPSARILVVDDSPRTRRSISGWLERWGHPTETATSGWQALSMLNQADAEAESYALMVVDLRSPDLDGLQLAQMVQSQSGVTGIPIILLTTAPTPRAGDLENLPNIVRCLTKPVGRRDLREALAEIPALWTDSRTDSSTVDSLADRSLSGRILLVEDSPLNQEVVQGMLATLETRATICENGREAVSLLSREHFDVVLMDCQMPLMDGYEATRLIRQQERFGSATKADDGRRRHVPIVAMTASAMAGDRERCLSTGMDDYLSKPFTREQLIGILEKWLHGGTDTTKKPEPGQGGRRNDATRSRASDSEEVAMTASPIDDGALESIRTLEKNGSPGLLSRLVKTYIDSSPALIDQISRSVEDGDFENLERAAHSLKSSSATLGAISLSAHCKELERLGRQRSLGSAPELLVNLETEFSRVRRALSEQWLETA